VLEDVVHDAHISKYIEQNADFFFLNVENTKEAIRGSSNAVFRPSKLTSCKQMQSLQTPKKKKKYSPPILPFILPLQCYHQSINIQKLKLKRIKAHSD
jgi:hypothetical protein